MADKNTNVPLKGKVCLMGIVIIFMVVTLGCGSYKVHRIYEGAQRSEKDVCFVYPNWRWSYSEEWCVGIVGIDGKKVRFLDCEGVESPRIYGFPELLPGNHNLEVTLYYKVRDSRTSSLRYESFRVLKSESPISLILNCEPGEKYYINFEIKTFENGYRWEPSIKQLTNLKIRDKIRSWRQK
jgi:hypothetical protein